MNRIDELNRPVTMGEVVDFIATALQIAADALPDRNYNRIRSRIRVHQDYAKQNPRETLFLAELLRNMQGEPLKDQTPVAHRGRDDRY